MEENWICIGTTAAVNPARREIRVRPVRRYLGAYENLSWVRLKLHDGENMRCRVEKTRPGAKAFTLTFAKGVTRDNIARLKNSHVLLVEGEVREDESVGFELEDLLGMEVMDREGALLGEITKAYKTAANAVVEIEKPSGGAMLLPVIDKVFIHVDIDAERATVGDIGPYVVEEDEDNRGTGP